MTKYMMLGNGDLTASLDVNGQVQELFFPSVDSGNHVGSNSLHHKIGIYSEGAIHWLDDGAWRIRQLYYPGRLISRSIADNHWLDIRLEIQDFVDSELNVLARNIQVINLSGRQRQIKLFLHQSFIMGNNLAHYSTAQYLPAGSIRGLAQPTITHYDRNNAFIIAGNCCQGQRSFAEYSIGHFGTYNGRHYSGVWCDAADGSLSGNPVEQGYTDSIIDFDITLSPHDSAYVNYQLAAGATTQLAGKTLKKFLHEGADMRCRKTAEYWLGWLQPAVSIIKQTVKPDYRYDVIDALVSAKGCISNDGAVISSPLSKSASPQPFVSPATAALTASTMAKFDLELEAGRIYDFFATAAATDGGLFPAYGSNGQPASNSYAWHTIDDVMIRPVRLIDTAALLISLCQSITSFSQGKQPSADWRRRWQKIGQPLANFLSDYIDPITKLPLPSYHLWLDNDRPSTTTFDVAVIYGALLAAAGIAELLHDVDSTIKYRTVTDDIRENAGMLWNPGRSYFHRGLVRDGDTITYDQTITSDALLGAQLFGLYNDATIATAQATLEQYRICNNGTYMRYNGDSQRGGNDMEQIMALSILMAQATHKQLDGLLLACQKVLASGGYSRRDTTGIGANGLMLKMVFASACAASSAASNNASEE